MRTNLLLKYILAILFFTSTLFGQVPMRASKIITDTLVQRTANTYHFFRDSIKINTHMAFKHLAYVPTKINSHTILWARSDSALMWGSVRVDSARPSPLAMVRGLSTPSIPALDTLVIDSTNGLKLVKSGTKGTIQIDTSASIRISDLSMSGNLSLDGDITSLGTISAGSFTLSYTYATLVTNNLGNVGNIPHVVAKRFYLSQGVASAPKYGVIRPAHGLDTTWRGTDDTLTFRIDSTVQVTLAKVKTDTLRSKLASGWVVVDDSLPCCRCCDFQESAYFVHSCR